MSAPFLSTLTQHAHGGGPSGPPPGVPLLPTVGLYLVVALAGLLVAPALTRLEAGRRSRAAVVAVLAAAYALCTAALAARGDLGTGVALAAIAVAAAGVACAARRHSADQLLVGVALLAVQTTVVGTQEGLDHLV